MPNKPYYGHWSVKNANDKKSMKNWILSCEVHDWRFINSSSRKENSSSNYAIIKIPTCMCRIKTYNKYLQYNTCSMWYYLYLEVCYLVLFFGLCSLVYDSSVISIIVSTPFIV